MQQTKNLHLFLSYVIPSIIGMLIVGSYSIVDSIFIGQSAGKTGLAAVAITWPLVMAFGALGDMAGTGAAILISQARGAKDTAAARRLLGGMFCLLLIFCALFMIPAIYFLHDIMRLFGATDDIIAISETYAAILVYGCPASMLAMGLTAVIRNDGRPTLAMTIIAVSLAVNIILDYVLIFPMQMGTQGAAWATLISQTLSAAAGLLYFATPRTLLKYGRDMFDFKTGTLKSIIISGIPSLGNQMSIIAMLFLHNYQSMKYGKVDGLAAYTFIGAIESLGSLFMTGLSTGVQPLAAYLHGKRYYVRQNIIGNMGYYAAFISGIILMLVSVFGRNVFTGWFNLHGEAAQIAAHGLLISSTAFILLGVIRVAGYYYQATDKIKESSLLIYGDAFFALPLCLFVLPVFFGLNGVWLAMPVSRLVLFGFVCYLWYGKKPAKRHHH